MQEGCAAICSIFAQNSGLRVTTRMPIILEHMHGLLIKMLKDVSSNAFIKETRYPLQNDGMIVGDSVRHCLQEHSNFISGETPRQ